MAVTLTYDPVLSRVQIAVTGLPATVDHVHIERSLDQATWVTVRGGAAVPAVATAASLDDYEFVDGVPNFYRVTGYDTSPASFIAAGAAAASANPAGTSTLTPALPAGIARGDVNCVLASIRNRGTGTVNIPTGYSMIWNGSNVALLGKAVEDPGTEAAPTVSFSGGVANATLLARCLALRNVGIEALDKVQQANAAAADIAFPALAVGQDGVVALLLGWKQDDWTSVATVAGFTEAFEQTSALGDDASQAVDYVVQTAAADIPAGSFVVTGGAAAISVGAVVLLPAAPRAASIDTANITPQLNSACTNRAVWLKSITHPFLNRAVRAALPTAMTVARDARAAIFPIVGRAAPVAVSDVRLSREWTMYIDTDTLAEADELEIVLATGSLFYLHVPSGCAVPGGFVAVGDVIRAWRLPRPGAARFTLPCTAVAAPDPSVYGAIGTWQTVVNTYATWADVIAAHTDWADLLTLQGSIADVMVP